VRVSSLGPPTKAAKSIGCFGVDYVIDGRFDWDATFTSFFPNGSLGNRASEGRFSMVCAPVGIPLLGSDIMFSMFDIIS